MTSERDDSEQPATTVMVVNERDDHEPDLAQTRAQLVWSLVVFQAKLLVDGLKDLLLSPLSFLAVLLGLVAGGDEPDRYFRGLMRNGRRLELWINLFGRERKGTADAWVSPVRDRVFDELNSNEKLRSAGRSVNQTLDKINKNQKAEGTSKNSS